MSSEKSGNLQKLIAVILIVVIALFLLAVTAINGIAGNPTQDQLTNNNPPLSNNSNSNIPNQDSGDVNAPATPEAPQYINYLTGLATSEAAYLSRPFAFLFESDLTPYGISYSDLLIEFATENGKTRYMSYISEYLNLGKLGVLAPTRGYMSIVSTLFGGIVVANGIDDHVNYSQSETILHLDISKRENFSYTENISNEYTSGKMIYDFAKSEGIDYMAVKKPTLPFSFSESYVLGNSTAKTVSLPFSGASNTTLIYDETTSLYKIYKNQKEQTDMLSGKTAAFKNAFVLFADTTTYEKSTGVEMVTDTIGSGSGYYISLGKLTEIRWSVNEEGSLEFRDLSNNILSVNKGNSYIGYFKSSEVSKVTFE